MSASALLDTTVLSYLAHAQATFLPAALWGPRATDDLDARRVAQRHRIPLSGSAGILVLAVRRNIVTLQEANALFARMLAAGYRAPVQRLDSLLAQLPPTGAPCD